MSPMTRRILWLGSLLIVPVPLLAFGPGSVPAGRMLEMALVALGVMIAEGDTQAAPLLAAGFGLQFAVYLGLGWLLARGAAALLRRLLPARATAAAAALVVAGAALASATAPYHCPFHQDGPRVGLLQVYR